MELYNKDHIDKYSRWNIIILGGISHLIKMRSDHMEAVRDYTVHIDNKKRVTLRGASYQYYNVREFPNGCIMLEPRELTVPDTISSRTLEDMDRAIENFKMNEVSAPIDLSDF
jgi:hypothetical protein